MKLLSLRSRFGRLGSFTRFVEESERIGVVDGNVGLGWLTRNRRCRNVGAASLVLSKGRLRLERRLGVVGRGQSSHAGEVGWTLSRSLRWRGLPISSTRLTVSRTRSRHGLLSGGRLLSLLLGGFLMNLGDCLDSCSGLGSLPPCCTEIEYVLHCQR